ncbi:MAG: hypothetical protein AVDCRST_MAG33-296 [uncultured Thermomicrobiales bacterium]|uniref:Oxidoreductase/Short-chain dehydrogenase n=1 Tax=uncultured Thermomicrobiales bacterium TaxID=1645740 RepID=A0A6J4UBY0_9BACT|nr:MAG: hypothetical protein AVDCRST_MAG33-296 [uncultured Thermomicrobiales bacterium]
MAGSRYEIPDQRGRFAVVTGANSGIGYEIAQGLASAGAEVVLAVRDMEKGETARQAIMAGNPAACVAVAELDVARLDSVARFAEGLIGEGRPVDLLVANAGIMAVPSRELTPDGFEVQFATNYLGHVALTGRLLPLLRAAEAPRVVTMSSLAAWIGRVDFANLQGERSYNPWRAYALSKLADLMFAREFDRRGRAAGWGVIGVAAHPGIVRTNLGAGGAGGGMSGLPAKIPGFSQSADRGAGPALFAATSPTVIGGGYYGPDGLFELTGGPAPARVPRQARDAAVASRLWEVSEGLTGVRFLS